MLKIAVFAPIPSASVRTAIAVNPGDLRSWRKANFKSIHGSLRSQRDDRIDTRSAAGWHAAGDQRDSTSENTAVLTAPAIDGAHVIKQRHQRAAGSNRTDTVRLPMPIAINDMPWPSTSLKSLCAPRRAPCECPVRECVV